MSEALAKVKRDLGRDAVILHTRTVRKGGLWGFGGRPWVEITATDSANVLPRHLARGIIGRTSATGSRPVKAGSCAVPVSEPIAGEATRPASDVGGLREEMAELRSLVQQVVRATRHAAAPAVPEALMDTYVTLIQSQVTEELAQELVDRIRATLPDGAALTPEETRRRFREYIASTVPAAGAIVAERSDRPRVVALVGPTGVGKTTTIAKLAAHFKLREHRRVGLITIDTYRIAAVDQLKVYAQIIDVPLEVVMLPQELADALERLSDCDVILIDTAGRGPNDARRIEELRGFLEVAQPDETHLVLASNASPASLTSALEQFSRTGVNRLLFTKLDEAVGFGVLLNVLRRANAKLSYVTTGQDVPDDIEVARGQRIADLILGGV